ncbi:MAG: hypothetical protein COW54_08225 [Rhodobacteraceae bacterium CG17_big_fil_post_rev_8_21_14_2_50_63_15]|nr:MAG: hypothetical protein COW54_08225 [Rhodobacteraceae bacterium CG17_big_fil_post_rev_8_21_14_2_50_63_15]
MGRIDGIMAISLWNRLLECRNGEVKSMMWKDLAHLRRDRVQPDVRRESVGVEGIEENTR